MILKIKNIHNLKFLGIYVLTFLTCFFPIYLCDTNQYNLSFCILEIPLMMLFIKFMTSRSGKRSKVLLLFIMAYFLTFLYYNINYLGCYWSMFYNLGCFFMMWGMTEYDSPSKKHEEQIDIIINAIIFIFTVAVVISVLANIFNLDAIWCDLEDFHLRGEGAFNDRRLTWVYMHKSSYGLLLVGVLALILKKKDLKYRKLLIALYAVAALLINSMVSLGSFILVLFSYYISTKKIDKKFAIRLMLFSIVGLIIGILAFYYIALKRDLSSLGGRMYIWAMYAEKIIHYPVGMGKDFYSVRFWMADAKNARFINNFHNVFLNEIIHYSMPVGVLYAMIIMFLPVRCVFTKKMKLKNIILAIALILPAMGDQAINDLVLPLYILILYLCFTEYEKVPSKSMIAEE